MTDLGAVRLLGSLPWMTNEGGGISLARRVDDPGRAVSRRLAIAAAAALIAATLCYLLLVRTSLGQRFDNAAYMGSQASPSSPRVADGNQLHRITADSFALVLLLLVGIGAFRHRIRLGVGSALAAGVAVIGTDVLKRWVLDRPPLTATDAYVPGNTFPSGHTAAAVACAMALVLVCAPRWRGLAAVVAGAYGWITAAQVQTAGWHKPSDAIGGALLAFASVAAVAALVARHRPVYVETARPHRIAFAVMASIALIDGLAMVVGLIHVLRDFRRNVPSLLETSSIRSDAYFTGVTLTVFVVVLLVMALLALLGRVDIDHVERL